MTCACFRVSCTCAGEEGGWVYRSGKGPVERQALVKRLNALARQTTTAIEGELTRQAAQVSHTHSLSRYPMTPPHVHVYVCLIQFVVDFPAPLVRV